MRKFSVHFERERDGVYRCMSPATFLLPNGHKIEIAPGTVLSVGTSFMGVDLAEMLEAHHKKRCATKPSGPS